MKERLKLTGLTLLTLYCAAQALLFILIGGYDDVGHYSWAQAYLLPAIFLIAAAVFARITIRKFTTRLKRR
jgi:hypothetical protein